MPSIIGSATLTFEIAATWPTRPLIWLEVDLQADQEHVEDQPEVGHDPDERDDVAREQRRLEARRERAEDGRPEHDSGHHLAHDARLAEPHGDEPEQPRDEHHDRHRDEEGGDELAERLSLLVAVNLSPVGGSPEGVVSAGFAVAVGFAPGPA